MPCKDHELQKKHQREWKKKQREKYRLKVLDMLGGKCCKCGINDKRVLEIDHKIPILRTRINYWISPHSGSVLVQEIITGKISLDGVELLCANCHKIKTLEDQVKHKINQYKGL